MVYNSAAGLSRRPLAVEVLDGGRMTPDDPAARQTGGRINAVALLGARRATAQHDRQDPLLVHARLFGQLPGVDPALGAELRDALWAPPARDAPRRPDPGRPPTRRTAAGAAAGWACRGHGRPPRPPAHPVPRPRPVPPGRYPAPPSSRRVSSPPPCSPPLPGCRPPGLRPSKLWFCWSGYRPDCGKNML
jgi:hypothetical protein